MARSIVLPLIKNAYRKLNTSLFVFTSRAICTSNSCMKEPTWLPPEISESELQQEIAESNKNVMSAVKPVSKSIPIITSRKLDFLSPHLQPKQAWVANMDTTEEQRLGLVDLHPQIFGVYPRLDVIHQNVVWQQNYKRVSYAVAKTRSEVRGGGRKPWAQKGTGRARHGSRRSPIWRGGGKSHGPRGPKTYFYMLNFYTRLNGLTSTLSVKHAQDYLTIVDSLNIPTEDPEFLNQMQEQRNWGHSLLFVDDSDFMPRNISLACEKIPEFNLMPVYGLNVFSMLKHETVVMTLAALEKIEKKLTDHLNSRDALHKQMKKYRPLFNNF